MKHFEYFEEILITSDTLILHVGKLSLMKESNMPEGAEMEWKQGLSGPSALHYKVLELGRVGPKSQQKWGGCKE